MDELRWEGQSVEGEVREGSQLGRNEVRGRGGSCGIEALYFSGVCVVGVLLSYSLCIE
jgi:hypothetical protein